MDHDRPIEKLLRRYATKRRDEAGTKLELHPATRRLLQGEVARRFHKTNGESRNHFAEWFVALRRRWVYATVASTVVITGMVMMRHQSPPPALNLAKNEVASGTLEAPKSASRASNSDVAVRLTLAAQRPPILPADRHAASEPNPQLTFGRMSDVDAKRKRELREEPAAVSLAATPESLPSVALAQKALELESAAALSKSEEVANDARADKLASAQPAGAGENDPRLPLAVTTSVLPEPQRIVATERRTDLKRENTSKYSQTFATVAPPEQTQKARSAAPATTVLSNFHVEQTGNQVRVIDSDGSTYLGELNVAAVDLSAGRDMQKSKSNGPSAGGRNIGALEASQQSTQNYFFRAAGTNRTLNQSVVFTWNFVELTNTTAQGQRFGGQGGRGGRLNQSNFGGQQQFPALRNNSGISGRAQVNAAREFEINAVPMPP